MRPPSSLPTLRAFFDAIDWPGLQAEIAGEARGRLVIAGPVNSGKSTLFNTLKGHAVSPVSAVPGTTTSTVVETLGPFTLVDTPGFGEVAGDTRAQLARTEIGKAQMVILLLDGAAGIRQSDLELYYAIREQDVPVLVALNKVDLVRKDLRAVLADLAYRLQGVQAIPISARTGAGVADRLIPALIQADNGLAVLIGRALPAYRDKAARRVIRNTAAWALLLGAEPIPGLDLPILLGMQARMVLRLAAIYGENITAHFARELVMALAGGLATRYVGLQLTKLVPGFGWAVGAAVAATGTTTLGRLAETYFKSGGRLHPSQLQGWVRQQLARGRRPAPQPEIELPPSPPPEIELPPDPPPPPQRSE